VAQCVTRVRVEGDLAAIPRTGPVLVIANHASNADGVVVGGFIPTRIGRRFNWLGKREVFDMPVIGFVALRGGIHAVERSAVDMEAFRIAQRILDAGHILAVFPEGTRSPTGALQEVKDGLAMLAQRSGAPVVPIAIVDSDLVWPRGRTLPRLGGRIIVRVGAPFRLTTDPALRGAARRDAKGAATRRMMGALAALLPPRQRGAYAGAAAALAAPTAPAVTLAAPTAPAVALAAPTAPAEADSAEPGPTEGVPNAP
jgi:1-acyl-sn-glycerol-3-phosphate acyltransferase